MLFVKVKFFIGFLILISGCGFSQDKITSKKKINNITIETPITKYNLVLKKHLNRTMNNKLGEVTKFILKSEISFTSSNALSVSGLNVLLSTKATVMYSLIDLESGKTVQSGSIVTFPALSSLSSSVYSSEVSLEHIKERLSLSSAKKLHMHIKLILKKLN
ncbi:hypothetical protein N8311_01595 [bacterium]|nr:hypothetical protein [bacterium]